MTRPDFYSAVMEADRDARNHTEALLGIERAVFANAMELIDEVLDAALGSDPIYDLQAKAKLALAYKCRDTYLSAWTDMLSARYNVSTSHFRTLDELPDFLSAVRVNPQLAKEFIEGRMSLATARRTLRRAFSDESSRRAAGEWQSARANFGRQLQTFSHVSIEAASAATPLAQDHEGELEASLLGGVVDQRTARLIAAYLASGARHFVVTCGFAFQDDDNALDNWQARAGAFVSESQSQLEAVASEIGIEWPKGGETSNA